MNRAFNHSALRVILCSGATVFFLFPFYWMVVTSLEDRITLYHNPPYIFPPHPDFSAYLEVIPEQFSSIICSLAIGLVVVLLSLPISVLAAYGLAQLKPRQERLLLLFLLAAQATPNVLFALPFHLMFSGAGFEETYLGVVLADATLGMPFATLMLRTLFAQLPRELREAALLEGATDLQIIYHVMLPLIRSQLITVAVLIFIYAWADFIFCLTLLGDASVAPVTISIYRYLGAHAADWNKLMATAVLAALPIIVLISIVQSDVKAGLVAAIMKK